MKTETKNIGLLGHGTIGSEVYELYRRNKGYYSKLVGSPIEITRVAVRDVAKHGGRLIGAPFTNDVKAVVTDPEIDLIIALLGDPDEEYNAIRTALESGKQVVTANKKALAHHWPELVQYIYPFGGRLLFEAAVCAGIQVVDNILSRYLPNRFTCCEGIVNGTTNYIFTKMREQGISFKDALSDAQKLGFAEPDPTDDIEGYDAAYKLSIIASLVYATYVPSYQISRTGMTAQKGLGAIKKQDYFYAGKLGGAFKMIASARLFGNTIHPWVAPAFVPQHHLLRSVDGVLNGLYLNSEPLGETQLVGRGAGPGPTAASVWSDVLCALGQNRVVHSGVAAWSTYSVAPMKECKSCHYIRMTVRDEPGVIGSIGTIFGNFDVSIDQILQPFEGKSQGQDEMIVLTKPNHENHFRKALKEVKKQPYCLEISTVLRAIN